MILTGREGIAVRGSAGKDGSSYDLGAGLWQKPADG
jgi:hypothetical protein